jgi:hypothetical protein
MKLTVAPEDRGRHIRLMWYVLVALILSMIGRGILGFDFNQTLSYGVMAYVLLIALNFRAMFARPDKSSQRHNGLRE